MGSMSSARTEARRKRQEARSIVVESVRVPADFRTRGSRKHTSNIDISV